MGFAKLRPLPQPPLGIDYYRSEQDILNSSLLSYQHTLFRAWREMELSGVLTLHGIPTVYVRDDHRPLSGKEAAEISKSFWNQGVATILLLRDPEKIRVFSAMVTPPNPQESIDGRENDPKTLVETIDLATLALDEHAFYDRFYFQLATGHYYAQHPAKFDPGQTVDAYLLSNLSAVRDELCNGKAPLDPSVAHAFLGRILFTCYLLDRGVIELRNYFPGQSWKRLHDMLAVDNPERALKALYGTLFSILRREFNGSMFGDELDDERHLIQPVHIEAVRRFLNGDEVRRGQRTLGFWAYDFRFIPVETISAIYENFLEKEDGAVKRKSGAYYTPRFLAEMTLDLALEGIHSLQGKRYLDPACGSGIFLVLLFNRLAAEWQAQKKRHTYVEKARALREILGSLRGVDKHATACRIACFSLYLAFLDRFSPPDIKAYIAETGEKLPNLLHFRDPKRKAPDLPVVWESDFFEVAPHWKEQFDCVVGNPPWAGRGSRQIAHRFMEATPRTLVQNGSACLLLPSKVFLNQTDAFQGRWLCQITLSKVVQLADYSFILFKNALCPCSIVRFKNHKPEVETHEVEYLVPKVSRMDLRDGVISVAPHDRKWIPLRLLLNAIQQKAVAVAWKSHLWGTRRDLKFLDFLFSLPRLADYVRRPSEIETSKKHWVRGQGFQPLRPGQEITGTPKSLATLSNNAWSLHDFFVGPDTIEGLCSLPSLLCQRLGEFLKEKGCRIDKLRRKPAQEIFQPPLVLLNQGFTDAAFFDYPVRFQDSLQSIAGPKRDAELLLFLTAYLRSKLARYFVFHTAANVGTERDKAHLFEVLRLPFFFPNDEAATDTAPVIVTKIAAKLRKLKEEMEQEAAALLKQQQSTEFHLSAQKDESDGGKLRGWLALQQRKAGKLQAELDPLIFQYFALNEQEIALVEDTCSIFDKSDTPSSLAETIPTLKPVDAAGLRPYATMLASVLNEWATPRGSRVSACGDMDPELGLAVVELAQTKNTRPFHAKQLNTDLLTALRRLQQASTDKMNSLAYLRGTWLFDGPRIYIVKPALQGYWTRTSALNDAADIHAQIAEARRAATRA